MWRARCIWKALALAVLYVPDLRAEDHTARAKQSARAECKQAAHGSLKASLDRSAIASPDSLNRILQGTLKWSGEVEKGFEGVFIGSLDTTHHPWSGNASWSYPPGQGGFLAELDLQDRGSPFFISGRHLINILEGECKAQAFYLLKIHPEAATRLSKAKRATLRVTGLTEAPDKPLPGT